MSVNRTYTLFLICFSAELIIGLVLFRDAIFTDVRPFAATIAAIAFFFLYEILTVRLVSKKNQAITPRRFVNLFMALKTGKILLSFAYAAIYAVAIHVDVKRFTLVFAALYFLYLLFDTLYLARNKK